MQFTKALNAIGLALRVGPLSLVLAVTLSPTALGQDFIDLEAERAAAGRTGGASPTTGVTTTPATSYPATAYPATSYAVGNTSAPVAAVSQPPANTGSGQNLSALFAQLQQLQQEVMMLNGKVEEQAHELRSLKEQSLERYVDLDRRLAGGAVSANVPAAVTSPVVDTALTGGNAQEQPGEGEAYRSAYALVRAQQFAAATTAFKQFLQNFPAGKFAPNAHYWLGELYLVVQPADMESSRQAFMLLLDQYPNNSKAPDAMYKLGKVYFMKGNREKAREYLDRVISQYGASNNSAVKLSRDFIADNY